MFKNAGLTGKPPGFEAKFRGTFIFTALSSPCIYGESHQRIITGKVFILLLIAKTCGQFIQFVSVNHGHELIFSLMF